MALSPSQVSQNRSASVTVAAWGRAQVHMPDIGPAPPSTRCLRHYLDNLVIDADVKRPKSNPTSTCTTPTDSPLLQRQYKEHIAPQFFKGASRLIEKRLEVIQKRRGSLDSLERFNMFKHGVVTPDGSPKPHRRGSHSKTSSRRPSMQSPLPTSPPPRDAPKTKSETLRQSFAPAATALVAPLPRKHRNQSLDDALDATQDMPLTANLIRHTIDRVYQRMENETTYLVNRKLEDVYDSDGSDSDSEPEAKKHPEGTFKTYMIGRGNVEPPKNVSRGRKVKVAQHSNIR